MTIVAYDLHDLDGLVVTVVEFVIVLINDRCNLWCVVRNDHEVIEMASVTYDCFDLGRLDGLAVTMGCVGLTG